MAKESKYDNLKYFPVSVLFHALALLPFRALYAISDVMYIFVYYIFKYRRKVAENNIDESFPEKSKEERRKIVKDFYRHFCDIFVETIKLLHVSDDEMRRRVVFKNMEEVDKSVEQGRSIVMYAGHFCNWELMTTITLWSKHSPELVQFGQVYKPLKNAWFNKFFLKIRGRFNSESYPMKSVLRDLLKARQNGKVTITGFISDQHPNRNDEDDVIMFLNHYTAFITGSEVIAKKMDMDAMCFDVKQTKRGYYECTIKVISRTPKETKLYEITNSYARMLENMIKEQPSMWLWTHKRWKRKVSPKNANDNE